MGLKPFPKAFLQNRKQSPRLGSELYIPVPISGPIAATTHLQVIRQI